MARARPANHAGGRDLNWALAGCHVLLTGVTGFLGQALLERLLTDYPQTRVTVLVRSRGPASGADRVAGLARKPVFRALRERIGVDGVTAALAQRVGVLEGDLSDGVPQLPADLTTVIHCASTVSFDPPIDEAFLVNVRGVVNLYRAVAALPVRPHVVHISTAYVAGTRKGVVAETTLDHRADWRAELDAALGARADVERDSRRPEALRSALKSGRAEGGKAGPQSAAAAAEKARQDWVARRLVDYGRLRAQTLGWTDVYTFTKALGERVAEEYAEDAQLPISIVRPAIVQSAIHRPYPGWFDSYKMADPIIIAYGRGELPDFPGIPEGVLDVIPVDYVTNATLAVAANPPQTGEPAYYQVGSGARNPLTFQGMDEQIRGYFRANPLVDPNRGHVLVPTWKFSGARQLELMLRTGERAVHLAEKALALAPANARTREWMGAVHKQARRTQTLRNLADLYGAYAAAEVTYLDTRTLALHRRLPPDRLAAHGFDVAELSWPHYMQDIYLPSLTALARQSARRRPNRAAGLELPAGDGLVAIFDLEGTVIASNLVEGYLWLRLLGRPRSAWPRELGSLAAALPRYLSAERRDRGEFIRTFMRRYAGATESRVRAMVAERIGDALLRRAMPEAIRRIRAHRQAGHRTVLITGAADLVVEPLSGLFDEVVASRLDVRDGVLTGFLEAPPLVGEARAGWLRQYAQRCEVDLQRSYAYGDSFSDRPLLEAVGNPVAVNPDSRLYQHAKRRHWTVEQWGRHTAGPVGVLLETAGDGPLVRQ